MADYYNPIKCKGQPKLSIIQFFISIYYRAFKTDWPDSSE
ncbi:MAG: hypothetical protein Hyperionvirus3_95 [Hyperionvirus sp.]|uniref:Uncharacterized protein n=1 Tax=Hyperionvirus sp. TaxID=2487770 RepID=A0A3G5AC96_9VIRU|nr:MAG: hypothetical protein Hyperionvirus3_95 [Hyperionvirus sp.]